VSIPWPSGSRLSAATNVLIDVTGTEDVTVFTGRTTPTTGAVPVIYCHGVLGTGTDAAWLDNTIAGDDLRPIAAWGHPVFVPNLGGASTWGNQTSIDAVTSILTWAATAYGTRTDYVALAGESMGALTALNWAIQNPAKVAALWLRVPCLGLEWTRNNVGLFTGLIDSAYGGSVSQAEYDTYDPMRNTDTVRRFRNRARIWATAQDEFFPLTITAGFAGQLGIDLEVIGGTHADGYDTPPFLVAEWIDQTIRS
jgi:pimeloyl-ACP methyl ester carboxylesterase